MNRIGVFVHFDPDNIVDETEEYLLSSLQKLLDRLIIVVNGEITENSVHVLEKYSGDIILRNNQGYDAGAYQDIFLRFIQKEELLKYDELLLVNNTFYGPFFPWIDIFNQMEAKKAGFWGLTKHLESESDSTWLDTHITEHIQSYFLVFSKKVFLDDKFYQFWETMPHVSSRKDAIINFEISLTLYFKRAGYTYSVYTDLFPWCDFLTKKENVYAKSCYDLLEDCKFPILKKNGVITPLNPQCLPALDYIEENYDYDINMLWRNAERTIKEARLFSDIQYFQNKFKRVFFFGCGKVAQDLKECFDFKNWKTEGYIETAPHATEMNGKPIVAWKDFRMDEETGVIVALGKKKTEEVKSFLPESDAFLFLY